MNIPDVTFKVLYSQKHEFLYHPDFHPDRKGQVALVGWRAIVEATCGTETAVSEVIVGLNKQATEASARDFSSSEAIAKFVDKHSKKK